MPCAPHTRRRSEKQSVSFAESRVLVLTVEPAARIWHKATLDRQDITIKRFCAADSGGPKSDIVVPTDGGEPTGLLAATAQEYAEAMSRLLQSPG